MSRIDTHPVGSFSWLGLVTSDQSAAKDFYRDLFGWEYDDLDVGDGIVFSIATLGEDQVAAIQELPADLPIPPTWNTYFTVDDLDAATSAATEAGATPFLGPLEVVSPEGDAVGGFALVFDPAGTVYCLWKAGRITGSQRVHEPGALTWTMLVAEEPTEACSFYTRALPWTAREHATGRWTTARLTDDAPADVATIVAADGHPGGWIPFFAVADVDSTVARSLTCGGSVLVDAVATPDGRIALLADAQGAKFGILSGTPGSPAVDALAATIRSLNQEATR